MNLHGYFRSSAAYRVRIALALKGLPYTTVPVNLLRSEQATESYRETNPQGLVPALVDGDATMTQSLAILEYLEERFPVPALLPQEFVLRARIRALALSIACDIHPLNNLRVLSYLKGVLEVTEEEKLVWYKHWIAIGFEAIERMLAEDGEPMRDYCFGDRPTMADCVLIPQVYNARRFECDLSPYPRIVRIDAHCRTLPPFQAASPEMQPDAP